MRKLYDFKKQTLYEWIGVEPDLPAPGLIILVDQGEIPAYGSLPLTYPLT